MIPSCEELLVSKIVISKSLSGSGRCVIIFFCFSSFSSLFSFFQLTPVGEPQVRCSRTSCNKYSKPCRHYIDVLRYNQAMRQTYPSAPPAEQMHPSGSVVFPFALGSCHDFVPCPGSKSSFTDFTPGDVGT